MAKRNTKQLQQYAKLTIRNQIVTTLIIALLFLARDSSSASAAIIGGLLVILPTWLFMKLMFANAVAHESMMKNFYLAEASKLLVTSAGLFVAMKYFSGDRLVVLLSFSTILFANWLTPLFNRKTVRAI